MKLEPLSIKAMAEERIREAIIVGDIKMGAPLQETALSNELGISRTPIREALFRLQAEGLVVIRPYRGASVFEVTQAELEDIIEFRETLEIVALEKAMASRKDALVAELRPIVEEMAGAVSQRDTRLYLKLDRQLHHVLIQASGSQCLMDAYALISSKLAALRSALRQANERILVSFDDHRVLVDHLQAGDLPAARDLLRTHIRGGKVLYAPDGATSSAG